MTGEEKILQALGEINTHLTKHDEMFSAINTRLDGIDERLDKMDERLDKMDERLDKMDERLDKMDERLDKMDERLDGMDARFDGVDSRLDKLEENTTWMRLEIENNIKPNIQKLADGYALLQETMATREQVESLREELDTEKFTLELLATKRLH